jgi:hypothetical protein
LEKVKIAITALTIVIMIGPLLCMVFIYRDNLIGLVLPPQFGGSTSNEEFFNLENLASIGSDIKPPELVGSQYFSENGSFALAFNFTNPIAEEISVDSFTAGVYSKDGTFLGNVLLGSPLSIGPNESGLIDIAGSWSQEALDYFKSHSNSDTIDVTFKNINVAVAGLEFQLDELPRELLGPIQLPVGVLPHED